MNTNQNHIPYTMTDNTLSVFLDGELHTVPRTTGVESALREALDGDLTRLRRKIAPGQELAKELRGVGVEVVNGTVSFNGVRIAPHLESRVLGMVRAGLDVKPWKRFVKRIYSNPSVQAKDELALFFENGNLPITEDGCFLAYKKVRENYRDIHSGKFDNSVGQIVSMPRGEVNDNRDQTCSTGLHFCSKAYLRHFGHGPASRVMILKINPRDVVSIPSDYNNTKGRCWRYEVVGEIDRDSVDLHEWDLFDPTYTSTRLDDTDDWDDDGWWDDDDDWDSWEDEGEVTTTTAFVAPQSPHNQTVWGRTRSL